MIVDIIYPICITSRISHHKYLIALFVRQTISQLLFFFLLCVLLLNQHPAIKHIIIIEDIIDTGHTLSQVLKILNTRTPKSLKVCTLLNKPSRREVDVDIDWTGFDIPDEFVIGYGIDYAQQGRNLPHIGVVSD